MIRVKLLSLIGLILLVSGISIVILDSRIVWAQTQPNNDYIGMDECASCHRDVVRTHQDSNHALTLTDDNDAILADFDISDDVRMTQFPDGETRPFTARDVEFVVGTGRYVQYYLYEVDRNDYRVLPARWDVEAQEWRALDLGETWDSPSYDWETSCAACHVTGYEADTGRWEDDGVTCEACHGPGEQHQNLASDAGRRPNEEEIVAIRGAIDAGIDPQTCGQCHSRGVSDDGLPFPVGYQHGGDLTATFTLATPDDTVHWWTGEHARLPNMQYNEWVLDGHSDALTAMLESEFADASCLECHSGDSAFVQRLIAQHENGDREGEPPVPLTIETAQFGVTCISCHNPHSEDEFPVNLRDETYSLCATCHTNPAEGNVIHHPSREMFEGIALVSEVEGIPSAHFNEVEGPRCATCHMPDVPVENAGVRNSHSQRPILPGSVEELQDSCTTCHTDFVDIAGMQQLVEDIQTSTQARLGAAQTALSDTSPEWVSAALEFVEGDGSMGIHNYAYTDALLKAAERDLGLTPTSITEADVVGLLNVIPSLADTTQTEPFTGEVGGGLTLPSIILLGIGGLLIGASAYAVFFGRQR